MDFFFGFYFVLSPHCSNSIPSTEVIEASIFLFPSVLKANGIIMDEVEHPVEILLLRKERNKELSICPIGNERLSHL